MKRGQSMKIDPDLPQILELAITEIKRLSTEEYAQVVNENMKGYLILSVIREITMNIMMRYHYTPVIMTKIKITDHLRF